MAAIEQVFTAADYAETMKSMCWSMKGTKYRDTKPLNCLYYWGNGVWSADCNNLIKASIWGKGELPKNVGGYWYNPGRYGLGDITCKQMIDSCSDVSSNFLAIPQSAILYIHDTVDHVGVYVGDYSKVLNGRTYTWNVIESSPVWANGIQTTYVDPSGRRLQCKGGEQKGAWQKFGKLPQINYGDKIIEVVEKEKIYTKATLSQKDGKITVIIS